MDIHYEPHDSVLRRVSFELYTPSEIRSISVKQITNRECFDRATNQRLTGGLYDPELGPLDERDICRRCNLNFWQCPGHLSHIEFPKPVYNPVLFDSMLKILRISCTKCHKLPSDEQLADKVFEVERLQRNEEEWERYRQAVSDCLKHMVKLATRKCRECGAWRPPVSAKHKQELYAAGMPKTTRNRKVKRGMEEEEDEECEFGAKRLRLLNGEALIKPGDEEAIEMEDGEEEVAEENDAELDELGAEAGGKARILLPVEVRAHFRKLFANEARIMNAVLPLVAAAGERPGGGLTPHRSGGNRAHRGLASPVDVFFMDCMLVPPPASRPPAESFSDVSGTFMHPRTVNLQRVVNQALSLKDVLDSAVKKSDGALSSFLNASTDDPTSPEVTARGVVTHCMIALQKAVNCCFDSDLDRGTANRQPGLKQLLDRKEGLIRMNMMGKRVNFACRSVISPDPFLAVDEVGLPETFARKLTFPEHVNAVNVEQLRRLVRRGPDVYPGAVSIRKANGVTLAIPQDGASDSYKRRKALAAELMAPEPGEEAPRVLRHVRNGDPVIMNRQPTLHRPSMQVHKARVLRSRGAKTIRMHYANCKAYNADFDGDEMNGHYVQTYDAKAEALELASVPHQYLVPKDGTPLAGLIQDHIIASVKLTCQDRFFSREEYAQLVFIGLERFYSIGHYRLLPPAVLRPRAMWTGKQLVSTLLLNLTPRGQPQVNLECPGKASKVKMWSGECSTGALRRLTDADLIVREGEIMTGILDKAHIGPSPFGLVHCFHEAYGPQAATNLLSAITSVLNEFLRRVSFSLGIKDLLLTEKMDKKRRRGFRKLAVEGSCAFAKTFGLGPEDLLPDVTARLYQRAQFDRRGKLCKKVEELDRNVKSAVKNAMEEVTNAAIPKGLQERFPRNNLQLMINSGAKGGQLNAQQISVCLGQIELEGKRVPLMLSGRSLPSFRPYDISPRAGGLCRFRFLTGLPPQELFFHSMAGRDGLIDTAVKTSRSGYLQRSLIKHLEALVVQYDCTVRQPHGEIVQFRYGDDGLDVTRTPFLTKLPFFAANAPIFEPWLIDQRVVRDLVSKDGSLRALKRMWKKIDRWNAGKKQEEDQPDTVLSRFLPNVHPGAISERMRATMLQSATEIAADVKPKTFERLVFAKCQRAVAPPGEPVGLLAAQSLGEPSTQMTLNTFHFAGRGEMNVTLGIPRLREILMVATPKIKTPCMELPVQNSLFAHERARHVILPRFNKIHLRDLVTRVSCQFDPVHEDYCVVFRFVGRRELRRDWPMLSRERLLGFMEKKFFRRFAVTLRRYEMDIKKDNLTASLSGAAAGRALGVKKEEEEESGALEDLGEEEGPDAGREWNPDLDGAEAVTRKGWAAPEEDEDDERDFEGEEEEEEELQGGRTVPQDEFDAEGREESDQPRITGVRAGVKMEDIYAAESDEEDALKAEKMDRVHKILSLHPSYKDYDFGASKKQIWCSLTFNFACNTGVRFDLESLVSAEVEKAVVYSLKNIERAFLDTDKPDKWVMRTEGINFEEVFREPAVFELDRVYTNNIHEMMTRYGVEAARACISKEVRDVFKHYGIDVDARHLSLVADYMTQAGGYRAFNRHGMAGHPSPLQRMSFETSTNVLKEALLMSQSDSLKGPSAALMVGQLPQVARRVFDLVGCMAE